MASTTTTAVTIPSRSSVKSATNLCRQASSVVCMKSTRRRSLTSLVAVVVVGATGSAKAEVIPLFGIRKKLQRVEEEIEKEAEKVVEAAEAELKTAEEDFGEIVAGGGTPADALQAGVVAGAELLGVVVATSIVSGILSPDSA